MKILQVFERVQIFTPKWKCKSRRNYLEKPNRANVLGISEYGHAKCTNDFNMNPWTKNIRMLFFKKSNKKKINDRLSLQKQEMHWNQLFRVYYTPFPPEAATAILSPGLNKLLSTITLCISSSKTTKKHSLQIWRKNAEAFTNY